MKMKKLCLSMLLILCSLDAMPALEAQGGGLAGLWRGAKGGNDPDSGQSFTVNFQIAFYQNGKYEETVSLGALDIFSAKGDWQLSPGSRPGDPTVQYKLFFSPDRSSITGRAGGEVNDNDITKIMLADLPNSSGRTYDVGFFPLNPCGQLTLQSGNNSSWGLKCVQLF